MPPHRVPRLPAVTRRAGNGHAKRAVWSDAQDIAARARHTKELDRILRRDRVRGAGSLDGSAAWRNGGWSCTLPTMITEACHGSHRTTPDQVMSANEHSESATRWSAPSPAARESVRGVRVDKRHWRARQFLRLRNVATAGEREVDPLPQLRGCADERGPRLFAARDRLALDDHVPPSTAGAERHEIEAMRPGHPAALRTLRTMSYTRPSFAPAVISPARKVDRIVISGAVSNRTASFCRLRKLARKRRTHEEQERRR